jgi:hypothetical protein
MSNNDIINSLNSSFVKNGWAFGELFNRIGNPFQWVDGDQLNGLGSNNPSVNLMQYLTMSGEIYDLFNLIKYKKSQEDKKILKKKLQQIVSNFFPKNFWDAYNVNNYIDSTISVKIEDYASLKYFGFKKISKPIHLDIGPGLGANALYSNYLLDSIYIPLEAHPTSYATQRDFFRALALNSNEKVSYTDIISLENLGLDNLQIKEQIKNQFKNKSIIHTPSWHYSLIDNKSLDLITATWVLNEVNVAGICWIIYNSCRTLKKNGMFYIRDSSKLKPNRHNVNYDKLLISLGFDLVGKLPVKNRVDIHGIPRAYKKKKEFHFRNFETFYNKVLKRSDSYSHGGNFQQTT